MAFDPPTDTAERGVIPYLNVEGAAEAAELYKRAFGAIELTRMPAPDNPDKIIHCRLEINGGLLMISDIFTERGFEHQPSSSFTMQMIVTDIDAWWKRATDAGLEITTPLQLMFWGDRWGAMKDRFGVHWAMNEVAKT